MYYKKVRQKKKIYFVLKILKLGDYIFRYTFLIITGVLTVLSIIRQKDGHTAIITAVDFPSLVHMWVQGYK